MSNQRTMNLGRKAELMRRLEDLRITIHNNISGMLFHLDPMDADLQYVERFRIDRLEASLREIKKLRAEFDAIKREIERLNRELGE